MALFTKTDAPITDDAPDAADAVLTLTRLSQHPLLAPHLERRSALRQRLDALEQDHQHQTRLLTDYEKSQALRLAEGDASETQLWRDLKAQIADNEQAQRITTQALTQLEPQIEEATAQARAHVQAVLDRLFLAPVRAMAQALDVLQDTNERLHQLERCSNALLQTGRLELFNPVLGGWLLRLQRKLALLDPDGEA
jgi:carboxylesterase type B